MSKDVEKWDAFRQIEDIVTRPEGVGTIDQIVRLTNFTRYLVFEVLHSDHDLYLKYLEAKKRKRRLFIESVTPAVLRLKRKGFSQKKISYSLELSLNIVREVIKNGTRR